MLATSDHWYFDDIRRAARKNDCFRRVLCSGKHSQVVLMSLAMGEDIGEDTHESDQLLVFVDGDAEAMLGPRMRAVAPHDVVFVPAGMRHNIRNIGHTPLKLYSVQSPALLAEGTIHRTREDALGEVARSSPVPW